MVEGSMKNKPLGPIGVQARTSTGEDGIPISSILGAKLLKNVEMSYDKGKKISKTLASDVHFLQQGGSLIPPFVPKEAF